MSFLNPSEILEKLKIKDAAAAADFGSGSGGWVLPLSKRIDRGKIYAIDIAPNALSVLEAKAKSERIFNIQTINSDVERDKGSTLASNSLDLVLMTNLLFEADDPEKILKEGSRTLKEGGEVLVVDWKKEPAMGPEEKRLAAEEVKEMAKKAGLNFEKEISAGDYHYALLFSK